MIHIVHRGTGGKYTNYAKDSIKKISRLRQADLSSDMPAKPGFKVSICNSGQPLTENKIKEILARDCVTFFVGDSRGLPKEIIESSDEVVSVSELSIPHQIQTAIILDQLENLIIQGH